MQSQIRSIVKTLVAPVLRLVARVRTAVRVRYDPPRRLVIGASSTEFEGWVPTDISPRAKYYLDATMPWPIADNSLEAIYADNMIEHIRLAGARKMLAHALQALQPGGLVRLATPDIEASARYYLNPCPISAMVLARARDDDGVAGVYPVDIIRCVLTQAGHHLGQAWDADALGNELALAGFVDIVKCKVGESEHEIFRNLEQRSLSPAEIATTLVMEARKPQSI